MQTRAGLRFRAVDVRVIGGNKLLFAAHAGGSLVNGKSTDTPTPTPIIQANPILGWTRVITRTITPHGIKLNLNSCWPPFPLIARS
jgi:hypothetical protein